MAEEKVDKVKKSTNSVKKNSEAKKPTNKTNSKKNVKTKNVEEKEVVKTKVLPIVEEKNEEVSEIQTEPIQEEKVEEVVAEIAKTEKKKRFWDEVKSFFILVLIIGLAVLGGWLFIKYAKPIVDKKNDEIKEVDTSKEKVESRAVVYETELEKGFIRIVNNKYLVEYNDGNLFRIMDTDLNVLYEAIDEAEYSIFEGVDGNIYAVEYFDIENSTGALFLYVLENDRLVQIKEFVDEGVVYNLVFENDGVSDVSKLVGVHAADYNIDKDIFFSNLNGDIFELGNVRFYGDEIRLGFDDPYVVRNAKYMVFTKDGESTRYGLYDLEKGEVVIEPAYEGLYTIKNSLFVAVKDGKAGIINNKLKKLVNFEYDFIDINEDFYVVSKNNKLAIMDDEYNLVTDFEFDYQKIYKELGKYYYQLCCGAVNTFEAYKYGDKYILTINNLEDEELKYDKHETYVISKDGEVQVIEANTFQVNDGYASAYLKNKEKIVIYDASNFSELYTIDLSAYDFDDYFLSYIYSDTIVISLDSGLFFNVKDGTEKKEEVITYNVNGAMITQNFDENTISISFDGKEIFKDEVDSMNYYSAPFVKIDKNSFYYINSESFVKIVK